MKPKPTHRDLWPLYFVCAEGLIAILIAILAGGGEVNPGQIPRYAQPHVQGANPGQAAKAMNNNREPGKSRVAMSTTGLHD